MWTRFAGSFQLNKRNFIKINYHCAIYPFTIYDLFSFSPELSRLLRSLTEICSMEWEKFPNYLFSPWTFSLYVLLDYFLEFLHCSCCLVFTGIRWYYLISLWVSMNFKTELPCDPLFWWAEINYFWFYQIVLYFLHIPSLSRQFWLFLCRHANCYDWFFGIQGTQLWQTDLFRSKCHLREMITTIFIFFIQL